MASRASSSGSSADQDAENQARAAAPQTAPLALYRRYRPATFAELKGQDHVTEPLRQALRSGRVNHAYLFSGPRGCGKTSSARILARSLNCEEGPTPDPCGKCASCVALAPSGPGSVDVIEIDAASHGGIDDARDLRERAFYSPVAARFKIYIIDEAHMVTGAGFNALLKLVEEPPPHLKFVFATTEPEKVIPTIRSRTHHYPFRLVPPAVLRELLEEILRAEKIEFEPALLPVVIRAGAGSVRDTLSILDQLIAGADESGLRYDRAIALLGYTDDALLDEMAEAFAAGDGALVFRAIDQVVEGGHDPRRFAMDLLDRLRDLIVLAAIPDASASGLLDVPEDHLERMRGQASRFGQERLVRAAETISKGLVEMRGATSPRLLLELMCAQVLLPAAGPQAPERPAPGPARGADGLDARVDRLERDLRAAMDRLFAISAGADRERPPARAERDFRERPGRVEQDLPARSEPGRPARAEASRPHSRPPAQPPQNMGASGAAGLDAATLRGRWPDILGAIRDIRKVAWILLSNASVESVGGNAVNLAFPREGDAKGFAGNGCDQDLADVIERMLGVRPVIRTGVQTGTQAGSPNRAGFDPGTVEAPDRGTGNGRAAGSRPDESRQDDRRGRPAARNSRESPEDQHPSDDPGRPAGDDPGPGSQRRPAAGSAPDSRDSGQARGRQSQRPEAGRARPAEATALNDDPRLITDNSEPGLADVTGTDLVMRELGGKVIEEISED
ncbi:MAG TPA: DNA polymerase III subunit gamma and tau [Streptosporangiaceae bacterium]|nr:DNA polymerase III subunit gamma and tau [Streptosporangiaceae bacterium]